MSGQTCDWEPLGRGYVCSRCAATSPSPRRQICGHAERIESPVSSDLEALASALQCPHRGPSIATVSGSDAGCGCASIRVDVYECDLFGEPVLKQAALHCLDRIVAKIPTYTGRTCRKCTVPLAET